MLSSMVTFGTLRAPIVAASPTSFKSPTRASWRSGSSSYLGGRLQVHTGSRRPKTCQAHAAQPVQASFLGVGAPEAVLVGVVALILFGPKGLAQAAKSVRATLSAFAPTIRELAQVSTDLQSTLQEEIGLNDLREEMQRPAVPTPRPVRQDGEAGNTVNQATMQEAEFVSVSEAGMQEGDDVDPDIERKREAAARAAWGQAPLAQTAPDAAPQLQGLTMEQLEAELARRKASTLPQELSADE